MSRAIAFIRDRLKIRDWIALCLIVAAAVAVPQIVSSRFVSQRRAALSLKRAQARLAAGELDRARSELRFALRLQPGNAAARHQLAILELRLGNWELAFLEFESLTEMQPGDPDGWIGLAGMMAKSGMLEAPGAALDKAIAAAPERADARALRGEIRFRLGRYHGARLDAQAAVAAAPADPALPIRLAPLLAERGSAVPSSPVRAEPQSGRDKLAVLAREHWPGRLAQMRQALEIQMRKQDWPAAERIVESARRTFPDGAFVPFLAGILELARGDAVEAEKNLSESLKCAPRSPVVATALAKTWSRKNGAAFAGEQLMRLAERDGGFAFARHMAARAYMDARDPIQAEAALRRGLVLQPDSPLPYQHLADHYLDLDRSTDALGILQQGLDRLQQDVDLQLKLAQVSADLGRAKDAIGIYQDVLSRRPDLDVVEYKLAALLALQDEDGASRKRLLQVLQRLESDLPSDPLLLDSLGWAHYRAGATDRARALLEAAVNGAPDEPGPHYHLAAIYAREKKADLARGELKAALESKRPFPERLEAMRLLRGSSPEPAPKGTASAGSPAR